MLCDGGGSEEDLCEFAMRGPSQYTVEGLQGA
jgi:hypothetical protein